MRPPRNPIKVRLDYLTHKQYVFLWVGSRRAAQRWVRKYITLGYPYRLKFEGDRGFAECTVRPR